MQSTRRLRHRSLAAMFAVAVVLASGAVTRAGQAPPGRPPRPGPDVRPQSCKAVVAGVITREVGNVLNGPPRNAGVPQIPVQLLDARAARISQTRTDRDGRYSFRNVCDGAYTVCPGIPCPAGGPVPSRYDPASRDVAVPPVLQRGVDFQFQPPPPVRQPDPQRR